MNETTAHDTPENSVNSDFVDLDQDSDNSLDSEKALNLALIEQDHQQFKINSTCKWNNSIPSQLFGTTLTPVTSPSSNNDSPTSGTMATTVQQQSMSPTNPMAYAAALAVATGNQSLPLNQLAQVRILSSD